MKNSHQNKKTKVLLVDDEPNILLSLDFLMRKKGYGVFIARNGKEALQLIRAEQPDIIILDIMMPEVDGYEVCEFVKQSPELKHIKIIILSAKSKEEEIEKGYQAGADLYFTKPFSTRELIAHVSELAER